MNFKALRVRAVGFRDGDAKIGIAIKKDRTMLHLLALNGPQILVAADFDEKKRLTGPSPIHQPSNSRSLLPFIV
jgi:hypothetical protein